MTSSTIYESLNNHIESMNNDTSLQSLNTTSSMATFDSNSNAELLINSTSPESLDNNTNLGEFLNTTLDSSGTTTVAQTGPLVNGSFLADVLEQDDEASTVLSIILQTVANFRDLFELADDSEDGQMDHLEAFKNESLEADAAEDKTLSVLKLLEPQACPILELLKVQYSISI